MIPLILEFQNCQYTYSKETKIIVIGKCLLLTILDGWVGMGGCMDGWMDGGMDEADESNR